MQVVAKPEWPDGLAKAKEARPEDVLAVTGQVVWRDQETVNPQLPTASRGNKDHVSSVRGNDDTAGVGLPGQLRRDSRMPRGHDRRAVRTAQWWGHLELKSS